jgi:hypothetical protein
MKRSAILTILVGLVAAPLFAQNPRTYFVSLGVRF